MENDSAAPKMQSVQEETWQDVVKQVYCNLLIHAII